jgi:hypothetical protein
MIATPTLTPKSLNEWTLEQNLVREIGELFDTPFGMFYPVRLRNIFDISAFDYTRLTRRRTKSYKLTPREEGTARGGWDAKFVIPPSRGAGSRVLYIQIKSGTHRDGNAIPGSLFDKKKQDPNPHAEFTFNDNGDPVKGKPANQHEALKGLNKYLIAKGFSDKSVLYCFPRVTDLPTFDALEQPLIYYTTFMSHRQIDMEAITNGANLYDGDLHHFRTCYINDQKREISSEPFEITGEIESRGVIEEVMMVKMARLWNDYFGYIQNSRLKDYLTFSLAEALTVNPFDLINDAKILSYYDYGTDLGLYFEDLQNARLRNENTLFGTNDKSSFSTLRRAIFKNVYAFINEFGGNINIDERVPQIFTSSLGDNNNPETNRNLPDLQLSDINTTAIVF